MEAKKRKNNYFVIALFLGIVIIAGLYYAYQSGLLTGGDQVIYVAVMRAETGDDAKDGEDTLRGIELYLEEIGYKVDGKRIELLKFDDQSITAVAVEQAQKMVEGKDQPLIVIGHAQSGSSREAGEIYKANGIPAITGSATADDITQNNEWYFRVIPPSRSQSVFLANYMYYIMGHRKVIVIHDEDSFGTSLADPFTTEFSYLGGYVYRVLSYQRVGNDNIDQTLNEIVDTIEADGKDNVDAIFFGARAQQGAALISEMKSRGLDIPMYGPSSFANLNFIANFQILEEEKQRPVSYSDDVFTVAPIIFDVAGKVGQEFRRNFHVKYGEEPGMKAATNYDAIKVAIEAIDQANISGKNADIESDREKIREQLSNISNPSLAVEGVTGQIYFDPYGNVVKPVSIGVYQSQQRISAMTQLQPIADIHRIADYRKALNDGRILRIDGQFMYKTDVVYTGIDFIEISNLNVKNSSYSMDFYIWFRYQGDVDADNIQFINALKDVSLGDPIAAHEIDGVNYHAYRVKTDFSSDFQLQAYPFDHQELAMKFRHANKTREKLIYVVDFLGMELTAEANAIDKLLKVTGDNQVLNIGSWHPENLSFFQNITSNNSTLGNPNFFGSETSIEYSRFNADIEIQRNALSFGLKNLIPLFAVTILAYLSVFLPPSLFTVKNAIDRGALMTVAFFHIKLANDLPGIGYTVALDYVFYAMYALIVMNLILTLFTRQEDQKDNQKLVKNITLFGKIAYPTVLILVAIGFVIRYGLIEIPSF